MKRSQLFIKTLREAPADEESKNAQLLARAGYVHKEMAGVYAYLPMGKQVLDKIIQIVREEMNAVGGNEISMTALQPKQVWEATGRWSDDVVDIWFKTKVASGSEAGLAFTHEEPLTELMKSYISSYKDLPVYPYQFQIKFRNEARAKSGLLRGREFWMKDLYSFSRNVEEHEVFYNKMSDAYLKIFSRLGLGDFTYKTFASGGSFSKYSHEFQTLSDVGEDTVYVHEGKKIAINQEVYNDEVLRDLGVTKDELVEKKAVEVGNIFTLGYKFSDALGLTFTDETGVAQKVFMGSYGIGPSRLMGLIAEMFADDKGLVWPEAVAPAKVYLVSIGSVLSDAEKLYDQLQAHGIEVVWDDRDARPGEKFADADLMGIPWRVVVSEKTMGQGKVELKSRLSDTAELLTVDELLARLVTS